VPLFALVTAGLATTTLATFAVNSRPKVAGSVMTFHVLRLEIGRTFFNADFISDTEIYLPHHELHILHFASRIFYK
jgi:hypothetical protein